jgi:sulfur relay (sulfurtransferase) complex TusBCD TusD component (DsrE family)
VPCGDERAYNALRLAVAVRPGMDARGLRDDELIEGARRSTLAQLTDWKAEADKVRVF